MQISSYHSSSLAKAKTTAAKPPQPTQFKPPNGSHEQKLTLTVDIFIPNHPDRTESAVFRAARKKLIDNNPDACCEICGSKDSLELHHDIVEWCDAGGIDWAKMKMLYRDFDWSKFDQNRPETFIDSDYNARRVLCKKHHTGPNHGIHCLPYPTWLMQKHKRTDFVFSPDEIATATRGAAA